MNQFIFIYCHGKRVFARLTRDGFAICSCGERLKVVT